MSQKLKLLGKCELNHYSHTSVCVCVCEFVLFEDENWILQ